MVEVKEKVPKIRFKEFAGEWEAKRLRELVLIERGGSPRPIQNFITDDPEGLNWVKIGDAPKVGNYITKTAEKIRREGLSKTRQVEVGDLILSNSMSFGKPYIMGISGCIHDGWLLIRNHKNSFDLLFLCQLLSTDQMKRQYKNLASGTTVNNLNKELVQSTHVKFPRTIEEQTQIGAFFSQLDKLIALYQEKLTLLKTQKQTFLQLMFPKPGSHVPEVRFEGFSGRWDRLKLGKLGSVEMCRRIYKDQTAIEGEIPFYKIGTFGGKADAFISRELFNEYKEKYPYPEKGAILISASGSIGRLVEFTGEEEYFQDSNIVWLKHDARVMNAFLKCAYEKIQWYGVEGTTIKRLYNKSILNTEINLPCIEEQTQIGAFFSALDTNITLHQEKLEQLKALKQTLLKQMFV